MQRLFSGLCQGLKPPFMRPIKTPLLLLLIFLLLTACEKDRNEEDTKPLAGSWLWQKTAGGIGSNIHQTPATSGTNRQLNLEPNGRYSLVANGNLLAQGTYTTQEKTCIHDQQRKTWIHFEQHPEMDRMVEQLMPNVLLLSDEAYDGVSEQYARALQGNWCGTQP